MTEDNERARQALLVLAGCASCGGPFQESAGIATCEDCGKNYCSRCGTAAADGCDHLMTCQEDSCGMLFDPSDGSPAGGTEYTCSHCGTTHCPFCRKMPPCEHLLETIYENSFGGDFLGWGYRLPCLEDIEGGLDDAAWEVEPSRAQLQLAFGALLPIIDSWLDGADFNLFEPPCNVDRAFSRLVEEVQIPVQVTTWAGSGIGGGVCDNYWSEDVEIARTEIRALLDGLTRGFERLAQLLESKDGEGEPR